MAPLELLGDTMKKKDQKQEDKKPQPILVTMDNAPKLTVKYLELIFARLGYLIKIIEEKKK
jgi:hypothetical protein